VKIPCGEVVLTGRKAAIKTKGHRDAMALNEAALQRA
jgi:hypothetical protein